MGQTSAMMDILMDISTWLKPLRNLFRKLKWIRQLPQPGDEPALYEEGLQIRACSQDYGYEFGAVPMTTTDVSEAPDMMDTLIDTSSQLWASK